MITPLNIVTTYPIHWTKYQTLRDFVQNFYDSTGYKDFFRRFRHEYSKDDSSLKICVVGKVFNYEWLLHIGASTKQDSHSSAGFFGEGFKVASLCALRDFGWDVYMRSGDWELEVMTIGHRIDDKNMNMLAYDLRTIDYREESSLILSGLNSGDYALFQDVLLSFYYPENPLLGKLLWKDENTAVYTRSNIAIPDTLPCTYKYGRKGCVFCAYQMLGTNPFDLVICQHDYRDFDRERSDLYEFSVIGICTKVASRVKDAAAAEVMLVSMRRYWNCYKKKKLDIKSWSPVIDALICRVSTSKEVTESFRGAYPHLLYAKQVKTVGEMNRRKQARSWLASQPKKYTIVKDTFRYLGYESLEQMCGRCGGFVVDDSPALAEQIRGFALLEESVKEVFDDFFYFLEGMPERKIIYNESAVYHGMAVCHKLKQPVRNGPGNMLIRYKLSSIYLKAAIFQKGKYFDAMATFVHEACHMFGGDSSQSFSMGLTLAMELLLINNGMIAKYARQWDALFCAASSNNGRD